jgi:phage N-6-adenine-methyltransferase
MAKPRKMPAQKPHTSEQTYGTPREFLDAVEKRFGPILFDLAASASNCVFPDFYDEKADALRQPWHSRPHTGGWLWLNPPFGDIPRFAAKCVDEMKLGARILMLTPASVGSNWMHDIVAPHAHIIELGSRMKFVGAADGYPKDLALSVFHCGLTGRSWWKWTQGWP